MFIIIVCSLCLLLSQRLLPIASLLSVTDCTTCSLDLYHKLLPIPTPLTDSFPCHLLSHRLLPLDSSSVTVCSTWPSPFSLTAPYNPPPLHRLHPIAPFSCHRLLTMAPCPSLTAHGLLVSHRMHPLALSSLTDCSPCHPLLSETAPHGPCLPHRLLLVTPLAHPVAFFPS